MVAIEASGGRAMVATTALTFQSTTRALGFQAVPVEQLAYRRRLTLPGPPGCLSVSQITSRLSRTPTGTKSNNIFRPLTFRSLIPSRRSLSAFPENTGCGQNSGNWHVRN